MEDKGYAFTPLAFLLFIPVIIIALSFSGIVNEVNSLSSIVIGGDVTATAGANVVKAIRDDTADAGRNAAFLATKTVIDSYTLNNNPYFGTSSPSDSKSFVRNHTVDLLNENITSTCREIERQTGRTIIINNVPIDPQGSGPVAIFSTSNTGIVQSDPFGFNVTLTSVPVKIIQNSSTNNQSFEFNTPPMNVYVSIERLEDPYIWVNTFAHNSSVIYKYPFYTPSSVIGGNVSDVYHFADKVSAGKLNYLNESLSGVNSSYALMPYYFPDPHGLTFFDRLENRTVGNSYGPDSAKMSTFILWNPNYENIPGSKPSNLDHEYFAWVNGTNITTTHSGVVTTVTDPTGNVFYLSNTYKGYLGLYNNYNF